MLKERQVFSMSVPLGHGCTQWAFPFCFSILLYFLRKANNLGCEKTVKLSGAYFPLDIVLFPSQKGPTCCLSWISADEVGGKFKARSAPSTSKSKASLYTEACFKVLTSSKLIWVSFLLSWRYGWKGRWEGKKKDNVLVDWTDWFLTSRGNFICMCYLNNPHKNPVWEGSTAILCDTKT